VSWNFLKRFAEIQRLFEPVGISLLLLDLPVKGCLQQLIADFLCFVKRMNGAMVTSFTSQVGTKIKSSSQGISMETYCSRDNRSYPLCYIHTCQLSKITNHEVFVRHKSKAVPLHAMEVHGGRGGIAPTHS
jgi:hypothetical protein